MRPAFSLEHLPAQLGEGPVGVLGQLLARLRGGFELVLDCFQLLLDPVGLLLHLGEVGGGLLGVGPLLHLGREVLQRLQRPVLELLLHRLELPEHLGGEHLEVRGLLDGLLQARLDLLAELRVLLLLGGDLGELLAQFFELLGGLGVELRGFLGLGRLVGMGRRLFRGLRLGLGAGGLRPSLRAARTSRSSP